MDGIIRIDRCNRCDAQTAQQLQRTYIDADTFYHCLVCQACGRRVDVSIGDGYHALRALGVDLMTLPLHQLPFDERLIAVEKSG